MNPLVTFPEMPPHMHVEMIAMLIKLFFSLDRLFFYEDIIIFGAFFSNSIDYLPFTLKFTTF